MIPTKEIDGELWVKASDHHQAIKEALAQPEQEPLIGCVNHDCDKCKAQEHEPVAHWSDCAVHNEPAYPKGECDCGGIVAVADYMALCDKYVALSDKYIALSAVCDKKKKTETVKEPVAWMLQEPVAWMLTDKNINSLQVNSIQCLIDRLKHAHHTSLRVRINGQDEWFQADWLKHMVRVTSPQCTWIGLTDEERKDIALEVPIEAVLITEAKLKEKNT